MLKNLESLKEAGYNILLVEMNDNISVSMHHQITEKMTSNPMNIDVTEGFCWMDQLYSKAQQLGMEVRFIDPEPFILSA